MLFEYFIRKLIKRDGLRLLGKFELCQEIASGALSGYMRKLEPDLVIEIDERLFVFDVKYKAFDSQFGVKREDLFQLHTYIGQYGNIAAIKGCGFIYPISEERWASLNLEKTQGVISDIIHQQGQEIPFHVLFLKIPEDTYIDFNRKMKEQCSIFIDALYSKVLNQ